MIDRISIFNIYYFNLSFFLLHSLFYRGINCFSCIDENKNPIDWWISLKIPSGSSYYVYSNGEFILSKYNTNQTDNGQIMNTVNQLYESFDESNVAYGMYNDEPPPSGSVSSSYGHSKGLLMTNSTYGFYLIHSLPHWPAPKANGSAVFPDFTYGQSFICVSINSSTADSIASNLQIDYPYIYDSNMGSNLKSSLTNFNSWLSSVKSSKNSSVYSFQTKGGKSFNQFAKNKNFIIDFWDDLVSPYYDTDINVETWRDGSGGRISSICGTGPKETTLSVNEIATIQMSDGTTWKGTSDHSKWCNAKNNSVSIPSCVGDLNRMCSQETRGGNAICMEDEDVWTAFNDIILSVESCWQYNPCTGTSTQCYWCPVVSVDDDYVAPTPPPFVDITVGAIEIVQFDSTNPDLIVVVALEDIIAGSYFFVTDNYWTNTTGFSTSEGVLRCAPLEGMAAGETLVVNSTTCPKYKGSFSLSTAGEQILIYTGSADYPSWIYGLSYTGSWANTATESSSTGVSMLPEKLTSYCTTLPLMPNYLYIGINAGTTTSLITSINNASNWKGSSEYISLVEVDFSVTN